MCQILCLTSHDPAKLHQIISDAWRLMALSQKDGYGASWFGPNGEIGFLKRRHPRIRKDMPLPPFTTSKAYSLDFDDSNDIPSDGGFLIIHGRSASNNIPINLANTHPFIIENAALVHNGSVKSTKFKNQLPGCTCDSELLLRAYTDDGLDGVRMHIDGKYAFMCLQYEPPTEEQLAVDPAAVGQKTLHIVKDFISNLHCGVTLDDTYVIATTEALLEKVNADIAGPIKDWVEIVFTGKGTYTWSPYSNYVAPVVKKETRTWGQKIGDELGHLWDHNEEDRARIAAHLSHERRKTLGPSEDADAQSQLQADYELVEKLEIERLEQEAIS